MRGAEQDRFLGALLGLAIGDALGMPVAGWSAEQIQRQHGRITAYHGRAFPDGTEIKAGEFTDETEIALCIVEAFTVDQGALVPEHIGARLRFLARGESKRWLGEQTLAAIISAEERVVYQVPLDEDSPATGDVAARGVPVGLIHAVGPFQPEALRADAELVTRLTHGNPLAIAATMAVAFGVQLAARGATPRGEWIEATAAFVAPGAVSEQLAHVGQPQGEGLGASEILDCLSDASDAAAVVATAFAAAVAAASFEDAVFAAVNKGGATDARGAIAGALAGAAGGVGDIPQRLIDDLEGRIYLSLAAPWFHRVALRRAGLLLDLRPGN